MVFGGKITQDGRASKELFWHALVVVLFGIAQNKSALLGVEVSSNDCGRDRMAQFDAG